MKGPVLALLAVCTLLAHGCRASETSETTPPRASAASSATPAAQASTPTEPGYAVVGAAPCKPLDQIQFICGMASPEDLAIVPGTAWVIASGNRDGGRLHVINVKTRTSTVLFPTASPSERFDATAYPTCPGPIDLRKMDAFRAHGLYLRPGKGAVHTLYVVHHGTRESIEVFEVDAGAAPPTLTWVGCAPALSTHAFNSVVALPEGGLAATNTRAGDVWEYQPATGWRRVPGSEGAASNGLEISKDGQWMYVAGWAEEKLTRLSRGKTTVQKDVIKLGFRPDNVRFTPDGSALFAAGHTDKDGKSIVEPREPLRETSNVARIDPQTLEFRRIFQHPAIDGFVATTTGVPIGDELWLGAQRGDRVAYLPMPK